MRRTDPSGATGLRHVSPLEVTIASLLQMSAMRDSHVDGVRREQPWTARAPERTPRIWSLRVSRRDPL